MVFRLRDMSLSLIFGGVDETFHQQKFRLEGERFIIMMMGEIAYQVEGL